MATGGNEAEKQQFGVVGTTLLAAMAVLGAIFVVVGIQGVIDEGRSAGVFPARIVAVLKSPTYTVAFEGPFGARRMDVQKTDERGRRQVGETINVRYWPDTGRIRTVSAAPQLFLAFGIPIVVIGLGGVTYRVVRVRRRRR